jgi:succinoglycan biosynthesis protein ExoM
MICSICIATYKRKHLLRNLLKSIFAQNLPQNTIVQIVVVDNDIEKSAEEIIKEFKSDDKIWLEYHNQPKKNISITRNVGVKNSQGEYLLFIDDDETADVNWVSEHLKAIKAFEADGVFGRVLPEFPENTPKWIKTGDFFNKNSPPTGGWATSLATSNCIIKSDLLKNETGPFNPNYGLTGGEDSHLFNRLKKDGAKFISSREAIVSEIIPQDRIRVKWLIKKSYQTGNTSTRRMIEFAEVKTIKRIFLFLKAVIYLMISAFMFIICFPIISIRIKWFLKIFSNLGHISAAIGFHFLGYK